MPGNYNNSWFPNYAQGTPGSPIQNQMVNPYTGGSYQTVYPAPYTGQSQNTWAPMPQQSYDQPSDISGVVWALGDAGATSYPVARGAKLLIMDATPNSQYFWIKETDQYTGRPLPMHKFRYEDVTDLQNGAQPPMLPNQMSGANQQPVIDYVPKTEFDALRNELESLKRTIKDMRKRNHEPDSNANDH